MSGNKFGKKIIALCLTFWLGNISVLFLSGDSPNRRSFISKPQNCVSKNVNWQYFKLENPQIYKTSALQNERDAYKINIDSKTFGVEASKKALFNPSRPNVTTQNLLHEENCF